MEEMANSGGRGSREGRIDAQSDNVDGYDAAVAYARKRRFPEALDTLNQAYERGECSEAEALDLQARVFVQQGRLLDAESCWSKAAELDSTNAAYAAALARLRRGANPLLRLCPIAAGALTLGFLGAFCVAAMFEAHENAQQIQELRKTILQSDVETARASSELSGRLDAGMSKIQASLKTLPQAGQLQKVADLVQTGMANVGAATQSLQAAVETSRVDNKNETERASSELSGRLDAGMSKIQASLKTVPQAGELQKVADLVQTGMANVGAATQSLQAAVEASRTDNKRAIELLVESIRSEFDRIKGDLAASLSTLSGHLAGIDDEKTFAILNLNRQIVLAIDHCDESIYNTDEPSIRNAPNVAFTETNNLQFEWLRKSGDLERRGKLEFLATFLQNPEGIIAELQCKPNDAVAPVISVEPGPRDAGPQ